MTDIHVLAADEPGLCTLRAGTTLVEPDAEKKIEDLEQEAKSVLPQVMNVPYFSFLHEYDRTRVNRM